MSLCLMWSGDVSIGFPPANNLVLLCAGTECLVPVMGAVPGSWSQGMRVQGTSIWRSFLRYWIVFARRRDKKSCYRTVLA